MKKNKKALKEKSLLRSELKSYKKKIVKAGKYIKEFLDETRAPYLSFSGGKDSTVVASLVTKFYPDIPVIHIRNPELDIPENLANVKKIAENLNLNLEIIECKKDPWIILNKQNNLFKELNNSSSKLNKICFFEPLKMAVQKRNYDGHFMGLRAEESRARKMNFKYNGFIYERSNGMKVCCPINHLKGLDVFAYLFSNNIPIHSVYFKNDLGDPPERIRVGWWLPGEKTSKHGYCTWFKYYYPDLFNKLSIKFPEVRNYV